MLLASAAFLAAAFALVHRAVRAGGNGIGTAIGRVGGNGIGTGIGRASGNGGGARGLFNAPGVPTLPCLATVFNCFLLAQFEPVAWLITICYLAICISTYFGYGFRHSVGGMTGWAYRSGVTRTGRS